MDQRSPIEGRYRFGPFLLDPAERLVSREGTPVPLTTRLFELLLAFVRNPGVLLTKSDLMDAVWPDRVVDEGSLTQAISSLRKALGDGGDDGRYIATMTGRGYSFISPVENIGAALRADASREVPAPSSAASPEAIAIGAPSGKHKWIYAGVAGALAVIAGAAAFFSGRGMRRQKVNLSSSLSPNSRTCPTIRCSTGHSRRQQNPTCSSRRIWQSCRTVSSKIRST